MTAAVDLVTAVASAGWHALAAARTLLTGLLPGLRPGLSPSGDAA